MDFLSSFKQETNVYSYDKFEDEDDVFYVELRNQVLQLTADDEDDNKDEIKMVEDRKQSPKNVPSCVTQHGFYHNWPGNKDDYVAPAWVLNLWRTGNGTGVFIPQISQSRRKNRPRRKNNQRGRTYKSVEKN